MDEKEIKVTGTRVFDSGAHRDPNETKGRYDLLSPLFMRRLAIHTQKGGVARGDRNWEAGMPMDAVLDSAIRHLYAFLEGDRTEDHLAAAAWNVMNLIHTEEQIERGNLPADLADGLPDYTEKLPEKRGMEPAEVIQKLLTYGEVILQPLTPDEIYFSQEELDEAREEYMANIPNSPYTGDKPYEHWDVHIPADVVLDGPHSDMPSHTHTFPVDNRDVDGKSCSSCVHAGPMGEPIPLSARCEECKRLSEWSCTTGPGFFLGPVDPERTGGC